MVNSIHKYLVFDAGRVKSKLETEDLSEFLNLLGRMAVTSAAVSNINGDEFLKGLF